MIVTAPKTKPAPTTKPPAATTPGGITGITTFNPASMPTANTVTAVDPTAPAPPPDSSNFGVNASWVDRNAASAPQATDPLYGTSPNRATGVPTAGDAPPTYTASTAVPTPGDLPPSSVPVTTSGTATVPQTTGTSWQQFMNSVGDLPPGAQMPGVPASSGAALNVPGLPQSPPAWQSNIQAPGATAGYDPVALALAQQSNIPGLAASQAGNWNPANVSYQGGHQASGAGDFQRYEDAAAADAMRRLSPIWDDRDAAFKQEMANRGIGVGTEAYQKALESQNRQRDDAYSTAMYDAMRYGLQAQGQAFGQSLSNAQLSQADAVNAMQAALANNQFGLAGAQLGEGARQFDASYGLNAANSAFGQSLANAQMANAMGQFNAQMGANAANDLFGQQMAGAQFNNAVGQQNFSNALTEAGFNRDSLNQGFANQLSANNFGLARENQAFGQGLSNAQLGLASQNQAFGQGLANAQLGLASNAQGWGQQMDAANLSNAMDQFGAMYGLDAARFGEGQRQYDANYILQQMGIRTDQLGLQNQIAQSGRDNALGWANLGLNERQLMINAMLGMGDQNFNWMRDILGYGGL